MSLAVVRSRALTMANAPEVTVEVHLANGLPTFSIVGLPDLEVRESRERVRAALQNCQFEFPARRITVNLAPADLPKASGHFDLPIALGILAASGQLPAESLENREFAGELSLSGALRSMRGALVMACALAKKARKLNIDTAAASSSAFFLRQAEQEKREKQASLVEQNLWFANEMSLEASAQAPSLFSPSAQQARSNIGQAIGNNTGKGAELLPEIYLPLASSAEAALVPGVVVFGANDLLELCMHLSGIPDKQLSPIKHPLPIPHALMPDMADVIGQSTAKRALEIAAAGAHHILMVGPPGSGKSMLAARFAGILPPMSEDEALTSATLLSASTLGFTPMQWRQRPFRAPHHSASAVALVGGGNPPKPGEITLAHHGVLFLDELPEFNKHVLDMLREPLEAGAIIISRASRQAEFPAACQLIAAMNPCPCGWLGDPHGRCHCTPETVARYRRKLSGPLLDRIDIQLEVPALPTFELAQRNACAEPSIAIAERVAAARAKQMKRQQRLNGFLVGRQIDTFCHPHAAGETLLYNASTQFGWSARAYHRVLKVARTIADLDNAEIPEATHIAEAIQYRRLFNA